MDWDQRLKGLGEGGLGFSGRVKDILSVVTGAVKPLQKASKVKGDMIASMLITAFDDGTVVCRGGDGDRELGYMTAEGACDVTRPGSAVVIGHTFRDFLRKLNADAKVTVSSLPNGKVKVSSAGSRVELTAAGEVALMTPLRAPVGQPIVLAAAGVDRACKCVEHAMGTDPARFFLNGIYVHESASEEEGLSFVATDGHRLSKFDYACEGSAGFVACIIPRDTVPSIGDVLSRAGSDGKVTVTADSSSIRFEVNGAVLTSRLVDGGYPDYARIFPSDDAILTTVKLPVSALASSVDRVQSVLEEKNASLRLRIEGDGMLGLSATGSTVMNVADDYIDITEESGQSGRSCRFNVRYMTEFLKSLHQNGTVEIRLADDSSATCWRHPEEPGRDYLLMPVRD